MNNPLSREPFFGRWRTLVTAAGPIGPFGRLGVLVFQPDTVSDMSPGQSFCEMTTDSSLGAVGHNRSSSLLERHPTRKAGSLVKWIVGDGFFALKQDPVVLSSRRPKPPRTSTVFQTPMALRLRPRGALSSIGGALSSSHQTP